MQTHVVVGVAVAAVVVVVAAVAAVDGHQLSHSLPMLEIAIPVR